MVKMEMIWTNSMESKFYCRGRRWVFRWRGVEAGDGPFQLDPFSIWKHYTSYFQ